jgi:hypothetical protein
MTLKSKKFNLIEGAVTSRSVVGGLPLLTPTSAVPDFCYVPLKRARAATRSGCLIAADGHYRTLMRGKQYRVRLAAD